MTRPMELAQTLLACLRTQLEAGPTPPTTICLRHGEIVTPQIGTGSDECCNGLAWVRIVDVNPLRDIDDENSQCISSERRVRLEMGVVRCLPWGTLQDPATCDQWEDVALLADEDHGAMEAALCCAFADFDELGTHTAAGVYEPTGPDGNCVGGRMEVTIDTDCGCTA
jgi:hypothetical protein